MRIIIWRAYLMSNKNIVGQLDDERPVSLLVLRGWASVKQPLVTGELHFINSSPYPLLSWLEFYRCGKSFLASSFLLNDMVI